MNDYINIALTSIGGIMTLAAIVTGYLYRELKDADKETAKGLSDFKIHVAGTYAPRNEVREMFERVRQDVKDAKDDIKQFIDAKLGDNS